MKRTPLDAEKNQNDEIAEAGTNDTHIYFASDAYLQWDEGDILEVEKE